MGNLKNPKVINLAVTRRPYHKGIVLDIMDLVIDSDLIMNYLDHLIHRHPTVEMIIIEDLDDLISAS